MKFIPTKIAALLLVMLVSNHMYGQQAHPPTVKEVLEKQLREGTSWNPASTSYDEQDLTVTVSIIKAILVKQGFQFPNQEAYVRRIKEVFGRAIDYGSPNQYVGIDLLDRCNRILSFAPDGEYVKTLFVVKREAFVAPLVAIPALIDYQKEYPTSAKTEDLTKTGGDKEMERWRDSDSAALQKQRQFNIQRIVAINMYIFQGSKPHQRWLLEHDKDFIKTLVNIYGYTKDEDFNRFVLQEYLEDKQVNQIVSQGSIGDIIVTKNCMGKLEIKTELLRIIMEMTSKKDSRLAQGLLQFLIKQGQGEKFALSADECRQTYAYLSNAYDYLYIKNEKEGLGIDFYPNTMMVMLLARDKGAEDYLKSKHYFGLPHLQKIIAYAKQEVVYE